MAETGSAEDSPAESATGNAQAAQGLAPVTPAAAPGSGWLPLLGVALLLLLLSQTLWLWQTWPVRELLQAGPPAAAQAAPR